MCTCGLRCRGAFSIKSSIFHEIVAYQELFCVACSRRSDSGMTRKWKARESISAWPSLLSLYFRVRAFSIPRTRLSRSLELAMSDHENDNENEKIKTNNKSKRKTEKLWTWGSLFGRSLCRHSTTNVVKLHQNGNGIVAWVSTIAVLVGILSNNYGDGYENVTSRNSRGFKLYRAYSNSFNSSNVGKFFWSWILKDCIKVQDFKEKESLCVLCSRPPHNVKLDTFTL